MKFRPLHDRVVVRRLDGEEKTKGGIIIPDTAKEKPQEGEVIAVGPGARDEAGKLVALDVKGRPRALRQVVRHRGEDRRSGPPDHEGDPTSWASSNLKKPPERGLVPFRLSHSKE
jgi:co-chaperonin GroES (HSP10)